MASIKEKKLHREKHRSWGVYCDRVLGMSVTDSNRIIASARVMSELNQIGSDSLPQKRSQAYELRNLEGPEKKYEAWALVLETCDPGDVTAKVIKQVVESLGPKDGDADADAEDDAEAPGGESSRSEGDSAGSEEWTQFTLFGDEKYDVRRWLNRAILKKDAEKALASIEKHFHGSPDAIAPCQRVFLNAAAMADVACESLQKDLAKRLLPKVAHELKSLVW